MLIRPEKVTWRTAFALTGLVIAIYIIDLMNYGESKIEKFYYWVKYRNWRQEAKNFGWKK